MTQLRPGTDEWLETAAYMIRRAMAGVYHQRSCIAGTRIAQEVLRYYGIAAEPLPVRAVAITGDALDWHNTHGWGQTSPVGHSVGIGHRGRAGDGLTNVVRPGTGEWDGHLVLRLPGHARLVDVSIDQADRPQHGLVVPGPLVAELPDSWPGGPDDVLPCALTGTNTVVIYQPRSGPGAQTWRTGNDWCRNQAKRQRVAGRAIRDIRAITGDTIGQGS